MKQPIRLLLFILSVASPLSSAGQNRPSDEGFSYYTDRIRYEQLVGAKPTPERLLKSLEESTEEADGFLEVATALHIMKVEHAKFAGAGPKLLDCYRRNTQPGIQINCLMVLLKIDAAAGRHHAIEALGRKDLRLDSKLILAGPLLEVGSLSGYGVLREVVLMEHPTKAMQAISQTLLTRFEKHDGAVWNEKGDRIYVGALRARLREHTEAGDFRKVVVLNVSTLAAPKTAEDLVTVVLTVRNISAMAISLPSQLPAIHAFAFDRIPEGWEHRWAKGVPVAKHFHYSITSVGPGQTYTYRMDLRDIFTVIDLKNPTLETRVAMLPPGEPQAAPAVWQGTLTLPVGETKGTILKL